MIDIRYYIDIHFATIPIITTCHRVSHGAIESKQRTRDRRLILEFSGVLGAGTPAPMPCGFFKKYLFFKIYFFEI